MSYKMKRGAAPKFRNLGSSPAKQESGYYDDAGRLVPPHKRVEAVAQGGFAGKKVARTRKPTYKEAWDNMSDEKKAKHGSYEAFKKAAIDWNAGLDSDTSKNKPKKTKQERISKNDEEEEFDKFEKAKEILKKHLKETAEENTQQAVENKLAKKK